MCLLRPPLPPLPLLPPPWHAHLQLLPLSLR
jgi:hypothetical protein